MASIAEKSTQSCPHIKSCPHVIQHWRCHKGRFVISYLLNRTFDPFPVWMYGTVIRICCYSALLNYSICKSHRPRPAVHIQAEIEVNFYGLKKMYTCKSCHNNGKWAILMYIKGYQSILNLLLLSSSKVFFVLFE